MALQVNQLSATQMLHLPSARQLEGQFITQLQVGDQSFLPLKAYEERCLALTSLPSRPAFIQKRPLFDSLMVRPRLRTSRESKSKTLSGISTRVKASAVDTAVRSPAPYIKVGQCLVYPPSHPQWRSSPKALISFLGGAFIGASPDVTYSLLIELLAKEGYLVVATPYNVTFDHSAAAETIHFRFNTALQLLYNNGLSGVGLTANQAESLPIYGVGHSNGALMQVLIGCLKKDGRMPSANVIISFNNKPASDAVPFFEQLGPTLARAAPAIEGFPLTGIALSLAEQALQELERASTQLPPGIISEQDLEPFARFADQIVPVFGQVRDGVSEFTPNPSENRRTIASSYAVPDNLLVKFTVDSIDESDTLNALLRIRSAETGGRLRLVELPGTHATPLAPDIKWQVGDAYSPIDAIAQVVRTSALADIRKLVQTVTSWLEER